MPSAEAAEADALDGASRLARPVESRDKSISHFCDGDFSKNLAAEDLVRIVRGDLVAVYSRRVASSSAAVARCTARDNPRIELSFPLALEIVRDAIQRA